MWSSHRTDDAAAPRFEEQCSADPIDFHNQRAADWEGNYRKRAFISRIEAFDEILGEMDLEGARWLDAGCGSGTLSRWLVEHGANVVGVDGAPEMIRVSQAAAQGPKYNRHLQFHVANVEVLPYADASFDGLLSSSVLEYAETPELYLKEMARVIKSGGTLLISIPNAESVVRLGLRIAFRLTGLIGKPRPQYMAHSRHQFSREQFSRLLKSHGFEPECVAAFGSGLPAWLERRRWFGRLLVFRGRRG